MPARPERRPVMITSEREIRALMTAPEQQLFDLSLSKELPKFSGPQTVSYTHLTLPTICSV